LLHILQWRSQARRIESDGRTTPFLFNYLFMLVGGHSFWLLVFPI
jgi:hypothetical protein